MSAALHLAKPDDLERLCGLVAAFHTEEGLASSDEARHAYLIGPARAPMGYVIITFGWSVEFGGMDAFVDEIYLRPAVRGRGIATETLIALPKALAAAGVKALHLEVDRANESAMRLYVRAGFQPRERYILMSKRL